MMSILLVLALLSINIVNASKFCCQAQTAECSSCKLDISIEDYCMRCVAGDDDAGCADCFARKLTTRCLIRTYMAKGIIGEFVPSCEADGSFSVRQCHGSTGMCWCVNDQGTEIDGTRTKPGSALPECNASQNSMTSCQKAVFDATNSKLLGAFVPQCEADGSYTPLQCHSSTGMCWCVNEDGTEIEGTRNEPGNPLPQCAVEEESKVCCEALTAECRACHSGMTVEDFCLSCVEKGNNDVGCDDCQLRGLSTRCLILASLSTGAIGEFVPQCESDGSFSSRQCHGSTGMCWCVNEDGSEISGTRNQPGSTLPECGVTQELSACQRSALEATNSKLLGAFIPQCEADGSYSSMQCHGSTGQCWCVNEDGSEIKGTRTKPGSSLPKCGAQLPEQSHREQQQQQQQEPRICCEALTLDCLACGEGVSVEEYCQLFPNEHGCSSIISAVPSPSASVSSSVSSASCEATAQEIRGRHLRGSYIPHCEEDGSYSPLQCHGSTGHCWCATEIGSEIEGSRRRPGESLPDCIAVRSSPCLRSSLVATGKRLIGSYVPQCEADGSFSPRQCHSSTGSCWCVDENGAEVEGTRNQPGGALPQCGTQQEVTSPCQKAKLQATTSRSFGAFIPKCETDGSYSLMQCHGSTGMCWCVNEDGVEISGTRSRPGSPLPQCSREITPTVSFVVSSVPVVQESTGTPCQKAALQGKRGRLGAFAPKCESDGSYSPLQCHGSTGYCWCVSEDGNEISGTRRAPGQGVPNCASSSISFSTTTPVASSVSTLSSPCLNSLSLPSAGRVGSFRPRCEADGSYSPMQCHGSTGYCWCVTESGVEIENTKTAPGSAAPNCTLERLPVCHRHLARVQGKQLLGTYVPRCDAFGLYESRQCHGSTGMCWCVSSAGVEISGTRGRSGSTPDCESARLTPCLRLAQTQAVKALVGQFTPRCELDGSFSALQCHGSTGMCWCVDVNGNELEASRVGPGTPRPDCNTLRLTPCQRAAVQSSSKKLLGTYVPQCEVDGSYSRKQCHGSTGQCWCVNEDGVELLGTRQIAGAHLECNTQTELSECQSQVLQARSIRQIGAFVPSCEIDGSFSPMQCHGSTGNCWCVNSNGEELLGTRRGPGSRPNCSNQQLSACQLQARQRSGLLGVFVPHCEVDGSFSTTQCHGSTGYCWCVNSEGVEIKGTRVPPGSRPNCSTQEPEYDCYTREIWTPEKQVWCCQHMGLGCQ